MVTEESRRDHDLELLKEVFSALKPDTVEQVHKELYEFLRDVRLDRDKAQLTNNRVSLELLSALEPVAILGFKAINQIRDEQRELEAPDGIK